MLLVAVVVQSESSHPMIKGNEIHTPIKNVKISGIGQERISYWQLMQVGIVKRTLGLRIIPCPQMHFIVWCIFVIHKFIKCELDRATSDFLPGDFLGGDGEVGVAVEVAFEEFGVVHVVDVVGGEDQDVFDLFEAVDEVEVLVDGVGGAGVPVG